MRLLYNNALNTLLKFLRSSLGVVFLTSLCLFVKTIIFHQQVFGTLLVSSLWHNPLSFYRFYAMKLAISIAIASLVFITNWKYWVVCIGLFLDVWIEANLMYWRSNGFFVDVYALTMTSNMNGFWSSILDLFEWRDLLYPILTLLLYLAIFFLRPERGRALKSFAIIVCVCYVLHFSGRVCHLRVDFGKEEYKNFITAEPFSNASRQFVYWFSPIPVKEYSIIHSFIFDIVDIFSIRNNGYNMTDADVDALSAYLQPIVEQKPTSPLILIIVESFESWLIREDIMPNFYQFIQQDHVLYAPTVTSQVGQGHSADGQMIINTGILPLQKGAACFLYAQNEYPSLMSLYDNSLIIIPHESTVWNQHNMTLAYEIDETICMGEDDVELIETLNQEIHAGKDAVMLITMSTHVPYTYYKRPSSYISPKGVSSTDLDYVYSFHEFDKLYADFFENILEDSVLRNSTIVITGDHVRRENGERMCYCPLIIYSSSLQKNKVVDDICFQMDIYPTILHLIGCNSYYWKGFGRDLNANTPPCNTMVNFAHDMSDKILRSNYFKIFKLNNDIQ